MNEAERGKITSEDYAGLIIEYKGNEEELAKFNTEAILLVNNKDAIVFIPVKQINRKSISKFGYSAFSSCFTLNSTLSLEASGITKIQELPVFGMKGQGILIGFIDTGIEYTHSAFKNADGTTRIRAIWDQTIDSEKGYPEGFYYGTEYKKEDINRALQNENPLNIVPSRDDIGHGTMLAGIAAGTSSIKYNFSGVVPDAEIIMVKLKPAKQYIRDFFAIPKESIVYEESDLLMGVKYLANVASDLKRPLVICIGVGTGQGARDGRGSFSTYLTQVSDFGGVAVVIAAGNEGNRGHHYYGEVDPKIGYDTVELKVGKDECCFSMEMWGLPPATYSIDIMSPSGEFIPQIEASLSESREIKFIFEETILLVDNQIIEPQSGGQLILLRFYKPAEGIWRFRIYEKQGLTLGYHIWLPMYALISDNTYLLEANNYTTLTSPANTMVPIVVTAYNNIDLSLYLNASKGNTRINVLKPDIAAPGVNIVCPILHDSYGTGTGTGVAAAHTAGVAAMLLEWGILRGYYTSMGTVEIKKLLARGAKRQSNIVYPNRDWGNGILDIYSTFESLRG